jgi:hypothetical protein
VQAHCRSGSRRTSKLPGGGKPTLPTRLRHRRQQGSGKPTQPAQRGQPKARGQGKPTCRWEICCSQERRGSPDQRAKKQRQKEAAADRHQAAARERPPSSVGEGTRSVPLSAADPKCELHDTVSVDRPQLTAPKVGRAETSHSDSRLNRDPATRLRLESRCELARYLRAGTDYSSPLAVRRIIQVADEDVMGSLTAVCRLDREVQELSITHPSGDPIEQMESVVQMYEEEMLEWEWTRTVHPDSDADPDLMQRLRLADTAWTQQVLRQVTKMFCMAEEICDTATKAGWQPCAYSIYRWRMEQEIRHLYFCFGGPDEEEAVVKAQKKVKLWLTKAHEGVEGARDHIGSHLREVVEAGEIQRHTSIPGLELAHFCRHNGPPDESQPCAVQDEAAIQRACRAGEADPKRLQSVCGKSLQSSRPVGLGQGAGGARR